MQKLKLCPFCGGKDIMYSTSDELKHNIWCHDCFVTMSSWHNKRDAIEAWNKRIKDNGEDK